MRSLLGLLLVLLLLAGALPAHAAIAYVQKAECTSNAGACTTASITSTSGNLFVVGINICCGGGALSSMADSKSNTYTLIASEVGSDFTWGQMRYVAGGSGGSSHTFTATLSGQSYITIAVLEISGAAASPFDKSATNYEPGATSHTSTATPTTTQAAEMLIGLGASHEGTTFTTDTGAGWTEVANRTGDGVAVMGILIGRKTVAATGTYAYTYTTSVNVRGSNVIATFKEAAAAAGVRQRCVGCGADSKVIE